MPTSGVAPGWHSRQDLSLHRRISLWAHQIKKGFYAVKCCCNRPSTEEDTHRPQAAAIYVIMVK